MTEDTHQQRIDHQRTDDDRTFVDEENGITSGLRPHPTSTPLRGDERLIKYILIVFWGLFWFWNAVDHTITTDAVPLFKGRYRYDGLYQLFSTIGLENQYVALVGLNVATVFEVTAFVSLSVALWYTYRRDAHRATDFFVVGMLSGIVVMMYFSVGDVIFGHRAELREHTLYWMFQVVTLVIFLYLPDTHLTASVRDLYADNRGVVRLIIIATLLVSTVAFGTSVQRMDAVTDARNGPLEVTQISDNVFRLILPAGVGQDTWEESVREFERTHAGKCVADVTQLVWPAPTNAKVLYLTTEDCGRQTS